MKDEASLLSPITMFGLPSASYSADNWQLLSKKQRFIYKYKIVKDNDCVLPTCDIKPFSGTNNIHDDLFDLLLDKLGEIMQKIVKGERGLHAWKLYNIQSDFNNIITIYLSTPDERQTKTKYISFIQKEEEISIEVKDAIEDSIFEEKYMPTMQKYERIGRVIYPAGEKENIFSFIATYSNG